MSHEMWLHFSLASITAHNWLRNRDSIIAHGLQMDVLITDKVFKSKKKVLEIHSIQRRFLVILGSQTGSHNTPQAKVHNMTKKRPLTHTRLSTGDQSIESLTYLNEMISVPLIDVVQSIP